MAIGNCTYALKWWNDIPILCAHYILLHGNDVFDCASARAMSDALEIFYSNLHHSALTPHQTTMQIINFRYNNHKFLQLCSINSSRVALEISNEINLNRRSRIKWAPRACTAITAWLNCKWVNFGNLLHFNWSTAFINGNSNVLI